MHRSLLVLLSLLLLGGCSSLPEQLNAQSESVITDFPTWTQQVEAYQGDVRLGGIIAKTTNLESQTRLELVNMPINDVGKPNIGQEANGRFVVYVDGFLDPVTYSEGRLVSVVGKAKGLELAKVGESEHQMPVMHAYGEHLWRIEEWVAIDHTGSYLDTCYGLYCHDTRIGPSRGRVIKEVK